MTPNRIRVGAFQFLVLVALSTTTGIANALVVPISFDVHVDSRLTFDGTGGVGDFLFGPSDNWVRDSSYLGQRFSLELLFELEDTGVAITFERFPSVQFIDSFDTVLSSPLSDEVVDSYTPLPFESPISRRAVLSERVSEADVMGTVRFNQSRNSYDARRLSDATNLSSYELKLTYNYSDLRLFLGFEQPVVGSKVTAEALQEHMISLLESNASFEFLESVYTVNGSVASVLDGTASIEGLAYSGVATIASVAGVTVVPVTLPATVPMILLALIGVGYRGYRGQATGDGGIKF